MKESVLTKLPPEPVEEDVFFKRLAAPDWLPKGSYSLAGRGQAQMRKGSTSFSIFRCGDWFVAAPGDGLLKGKSLHRVRENHNRASKEGFFQTAPLDRLPDGHYVFAGKGMVAMERGGAQSKLLFLRKRDEESFVAIVGRMSLAVGVDMHVIRNHNGLTIVRVAKTPEARHGNLDSQGLHRSKIFHMFINGRLEEVHPV